MEHSNNSIRTDHIDDRNEFKKTQEEKQKLKQLKKEYKDKMKAEEK